jgi:hypothetical protein
MYYGYIYSIYISFCKTSLVVTKSCGNLQFYVCVCMCLRSLLQLPTNNFVSGSLKNLTHKSAKVTQLYYMYITLK